MGHDAKLEFSNLICKAVKFHQFENLFKLSNTINRQILLDAVLLYCCLVISQIGFTRKSIKSPEIQIQSCICVIKKYKWGTSSRSEHYKRIPDRFT